jgi:DNA-directed RNA polymerase subunit beta'
MAVHVPLSHEAQLEALLLMLAPNNIMPHTKWRPDCSSISRYGAWIILSYKKQARCNWRRKNVQQYRRMISALIADKVEVGTKIKIRLNGQLIETTVGRVIFNQVVPKELGYINELLTKKRLRIMIGQSFREAGLARTVELLDELKDLGFNYQQLVDYR